MRLKRNILILMACMAISPAVMAQKDIRQQIRKGNKAYQDSIFRDAEIAYRKAIDASPKEERGMAHFNLGNSLFVQKKADEALKEYETAMRYTKDDKQLAEIYHNIGVVQQEKKEFEKAVESYKLALKKNPKDDETRYNLALLLSQQENQQNQDDKKDDKNEDKKDDKQDQNKDNKDNQDKKDDKKDKQDQQQQQQNQQDISKDAAEKLLESVLRDEKKTQEKVQKQQVMRGKNKMEKEW